MTKARSARGVMVDFDLLKIKQNMAKAPVSVDVRTRQDFIESRTKRKTKKAVEDSIEINTIPEDMPEPPSAPNEELINEDVTTETSEVVKEDESVDIVEEDTVVNEVVSTTTKQKARRNKK